MSPASNKQQATLHQIQSGISVTTPYHMILQSRRIDRNPKKE
ncbi:predicted protein [Botrytis cinerea T4]|uniref:Uncharacterized protein n=1 Tax=Botryotinia fuckeliana (strain T4) TaxID=999810 RepID=G2Y0C2_BOTF4|nr:predicted protein [Botrytis cinerea T4]